MIWPFGGGPIGAWFDRRRALREMRRMAAIEKATLTLQDDNPLHRAKVSIEQGDKAAARHYLQLARERIPDYVLSSPETVEVLVGLGEHDELAAYGLAGMKRFPREPRYPEAYATAAECARDFDEAIRRWALVRKKFPRSRAGYVDAVGCLRQTGRLDEAIALIRRAEALMPDDIRVILEAGRVVDARGDWDAAYHYWYRVRSKHPAGYFVAAQALHQLGRTAEAEALLAEARFRNPIEPSIAILNARIAEAGNPAEALKRWMFVRQRFPLEQAGYRDGLRLAIEQQDWDEADSVAQQAIHRFPDDDWPLVEYAHVAHARQDWSEAAKRWSAVAAAFPGRGDAERHAAEATAKAAAGR